MKLRAMDGLVAAALVVGMVWAWPRPEAAVDPAPVVRAATAATPRARAPLPTRTEPDAYARAEAQAVRPAHLVLPTARGLTDAPRVVLNLLEDDGTRPELAMVYSPDCGISHMATEGVVALQLPPGTCTFIGRRPSGLLLHQTEPMTLVLEAGDDWEQDLVFPPGETGGLGASLSRHPAGVRLSTVLPGMGAHQAGLRAGDVVVAIEGETVTGMTLDEVVRHMTGSVGSLVDMDVLDGDPLEGTFTARVRRTYLPRAD